MTESLFLSCTLSCWQSYEFFLKASVTQCNFSRSLQHVICALINLSRTFFAVAVTAQIKLVLHYAAFLAIRLAKKKSISKLQETCYTFQSLAAFKKVTAIIAESIEPSSTLYNRCKPKKFERQVAKRAC